MLKIRLSRAGKNSQPSFRIVVQEHTSPIKGKFIEELGYYRPATKNKDFSVKMERVNYWLSVGAQPSDAIAVLLKNQGVKDMEKFMEPRDRKRKKKKVTEEAAAPAPAPAPTPAAPAAPEVAEAPAPAVENPV